MKTISIVTPCYNEEANVEELYNQVKEICEQLDGYTYEHIFLLIMLQKIIPLQY